MVKFDWEEATYGTDMCRSIEGIVVYHNKYDNVFSVAHSDNTNEYIAHRITKDEMLEVINKYKMEKYGKVLPSQSDTWAGISNTVEEFDVWKKRTMSFDNEEAELLPYLLEQMVAEAKPLADIKFNNPVAGLINYMSETNNRMRELMFAYLSIVVAGDDGLAKKLIAGERLQIGLNTDYIAATCCYGKQPELSLKEAVDSLNESQKSSGPKIG